MAIFPPSLRGLSRRFAATLAVLVLAGSVALVAVFSWLDARHASAEFARKAADNARFVERTGFPRSAQLAGQLSTLLGAHVYFRNGDGPWLAGPEAPPLPDTLRSDVTGPQHLPGGAIVAVAPLDGTGHMALLSLPGQLRPSVFHPGLVTTLAAFVAVALATGWGLARGLIRPLRSLAAALPRVTSITSLPESGRPDEIGDLARSLAATAADLREERRRREQADRFALLGRMTTAMAHEVRNPVAAIRLHAQLLESGAPPDAAPSLECIVRETARIDSLVHQWMLLARPEPPAMNPCDARRLLAEAIDAIRPAADRAAITLAVALPPDELLLHGDRVRLAQALANLLQNAVHATPEGGRIHASLAASGSRAAFTLTDSGPGFSTAALARWAEPFFSDKEGGMGLGLTVASEVAAAHGGSLTAANSPEGGAVLTLSIPLAVS